MVTSHKMMTLPLDFGKETSSEGNCSGGVEQKKVQHD